MAGNGLRPHAERAKSRAASGSVEGNIGIQQKGYVVAFDLQIAFINIRGKGEGVQFFGVQLGTLSVVSDLVVFTVTDSQNLAERFAVRVLHDGMVELAAGHKINILAGI